MAEFVRPMSSARVPELRLSVIDRVRNNENASPELVEESFAHTSEDLQESIRPLQMIEAPLELPTASLAVTFGELPTPPRSTRPKPKRRLVALTSLCCCSALEVLDAFCITIDRVVDVLDTCGYRVVTSLAYCCLICCSQRVMMAGTHPQQVTEQNLRDQDIDDCLDTCCCGVCRIPRWCCAYCWCICDEVEDELVRPAPCTSQLRQLFQRTLLVLCIFGMVVVVYMIVVGGVAFVATCTTGQCVLG